MSEHLSNIEVEGGSPRGFGIVFAFVFALIGIWPMISGLPPRILMLGFALLMVILAIFVPKVFELPNRIWFKLGMLLGMIIAPVVMAFVYLFAIVPTGLFVRLRGKDLLGLKMDKSKSSYWIERKEGIQTMKNQF